ncbi:MAG: SDR family oxidoreductase [Deltaproteobacteria bacterium]|nr:SDR family oxidoreductase [Deltaproteobacteria bacterium]
MTNAFSNLQTDLHSKPATWVITGVAGFIGSHLLENLLRLNQNVRGIDNFATGKKENLALVERAVGKEAWSKFTFTEGDILDAEKLQRVCQGCDYVLHQAALGSVPRSIAAPLDTNRANVDGFLQVMLAARDCKAKRFVYASSSSVYGSDASLPKREDVIGEQLSPYAVSKYTNELYAKTFSRAYGIETVGLRYFNVFGARQDPQGMYAAVIPRWISSLVAGKTCTIFGDGETSRDFCYIDNVVQANLLAACQPLAERAPVVNIAFGGKTSLKDLYGLIADSLVKLGAIKAKPSPEFADFRAGDIRHSNADISKATRLLGYAPLFDLPSGIEKTVQWYVEYLKAQRTV